MQESRHVRSVRVSRWDPLALAGLVKLGKSGGPSLPETSLTMLYNLQYLKFIAASLVIVHYIFHFQHSFGIGPPQFEIGAAGVDLFFVISGFIMVFITEKREQAPLEFFRHRLERVAPPYWLVTIFIAITLLLAPQEFSASQFSFRHFLASLLFLPYPSPGTGYALPIYIPGWTLNYEFFFYTIFAVVISINFRLRAAIASLILASIVIFGSFLGDSSFYLGFYKDPILLEFTYGMLIAWLVNRGFAKQFSAPQGFVLLGVAGFVVAALYGRGEGSPERFLVWGAPAALIVVGNVLLELKGKTRSIKMLVLLGDSSYAIYVTHYIVLQVVFKVYMSAWPHMPLHYTLVPSFVVCILFGVGFHIAIEQPIMSFLARRRRERT